MLDGMKTLETLKQMVDNPQQNYWNRLKDSLDIDINDIIQNFESIMKPIMDDNGLVNAELAKSLTATKFPLLSNILPTSNFRLVDAADGVINILQSLIRGR